MILSKRRILQIVHTGMKNFILNKPICVSFELLASCTCNCRHCNWGGEVEESLMSPQEISDTVKMLNPPNVQLSGGEPLLRDDIVEVVRTIKRDNSVPYIVFVSNGSLMTEEKYIALKNAGVDQFSLSLDFPDERHDDFRRHPGLFRHLNEVVPRLASYGYNNIVLNTAITHVNFRELKEIARLALAWGVLISFSAYTVLRTGNTEYGFRTREDLDLLQSTFDEHIKMKKEKRHIVASESTLKKTYQFFRDGKIPGCKAGKRFLVVTPSGMLLPCALHRKSLFKSQREMVENFSNRNKCGGCYVSVRSYTEKSFSDLLSSSLSSLHILSRSPCTAASSGTAHEPAGMEMADKES